MFALLLPTFVNVVNSLPADGSSGEHGNRNKSFRTAMVVATGVAAGAAGVSAAVAVQSSSEAADATVANERRLADRRARDAARRAANSPEQVAAANENRRAQYAKSPEQVAAANEKRRAQYAARRAKQIDQAALASTEKRQVLTPIMTAEDIANACAGRQTSVAAIAAVTVAACNLARSEYASNNSTSAARTRVYRAAMTPEEVAAANSADAARMRAHRVAMTPEEVAAANTAHAAHMRARRST